MVVRNTQGCFATYYWTVLLSCFFVAATSLPLKYFDIDLDLAPKKRWNEVSRVYREYIVGQALALKGFNAANFEPGFAENFVSSANWEKFPDLVEEMEGIVAEVNHPDVTLTFVKQWQMVYELKYAWGCSAVLLAQPDGTVLHGRNMDYSIPVEVDNKTLNGQHMTLQVTMYKNKKPLFQATQWAGMVGVHTGMRLHGYTVEQQTRFGMNHAQLSLENGKKGGVPFYPVVRKTLETVADFKTALDTLYSTSFMAAQYLVMSGIAPFEGCILSLDALGKHEPGTPAIQCLSEKKRHLVQTNSDFSKPVKLQGRWDPRGQWAQWALERQGSEVMSPDALNQFLHTIPYLTPFNLFSTVMIPATDYYITTLPGEVPTKNFKYWLNYLRCVQVLTTLLMVCIPCCLLGILRRLCGK